MLDIVSLMEFAPCPWCSTFEPAEARIIIRKHLGDNKLSESLIGWDSLQHLTERLDDAKKCRSAL